MGMNEGDGGGGGESKHPLWGKGKKGRISSCNGGGGWLLKRRKFLHRDKVGERNAWRKNSRKERISGQSSPVTLKSDGNKDRIGAKWWGEGRKTQRRDHCPSKGVTCEKSNQVTVRIRGKKWGGSVKDQTTIWKRHSGDYALNVGRKQKKMWVRRTGVWWVLLRGEKGSVSLSENKRRVVDF